MITKIIVTIIYLGIVAYLGVLGYKNTKTVGDYLVGGRKVNPIIMALSYGATFISTSAIIGFGGNAGVFGFSLLWLTFLNIFLGIFIAFVFFGKRTRRMGHNLQAHTFPELLGKRYDSKFIQKFSALVIFIFMPVYAAAVMIGAAKFLESSLKIDYNVALFVFAAIVAVYVFFGGIKGVMYTDAFQGTLMLIGMSILLVAVYAKLGGITAAHQALGDLLKDSTVLGQVKGLQDGGFRGWTTMPELYSKYWWTVISSITLGVGVGVLAQPQLVVRFMTVKSDKEINRAIPIGGVFILLMTGVAFVVGALSNVFFFKTVGTISVVAAKGSTDSIIPLFLNNYMPEWFLSVFLIIMLAAGMSTISSQFHAVGTAVGRDLFNTADKDPKKAMLITKAGVVIAILFTVALAYLLPQVWDGAIAISTGLFFGLCCAAFLPMYFGAMYLRKLTKTAAISGMVTGFSVSLLWMMFIHSKESAVLKICQLIFGKPMLVETGTLQFVDPIIVALAASIIVTALVQIFSKSRNSEEHIEKCFYGIK